MSSDRLARAHRLLPEAVAALEEATGPGATAGERLSVLTLCEGAVRRLDRVTVSTVAGLHRDGTFTERGYRNPANALADLLHWDRADARRRTLAADHVHPSTGLDGAELPARLPTTAHRFTEARIGLRMSTSSPPCSLARRSPGRPGPARGRRDPDRRARLPGQPHRAPHLGDPADRRARRGRPRPRRPTDDRPPERRRAEALAEICARTLDHAQLPETGGRRPVLNVLIGLEDLQRRARAAVLDLGGQCTPETLRMLACDAAVVPIVMNGRGQPLDVGRARRTIPDGLRRAVTARDRGCAHPGCDRPPSWCEIHHIVPWEADGETALDNCVMLCKIHHRLLHHSPWTVRIRDGLPEFVPPRWIDPLQRPRRQSAYAAVA